VKYQNTELKSNKMKTSVVVNDLDKVKPIRFAIFMMIATLLCIVIFGYFSSDEEIEWFIATAGLGLFAWMNAVLAFFSPNWANHALKSILSYIIMVFLYLGTAYLISTTSFFDLREYQLMLTSTTMFFVVAIFMAKLIKGITEFFSRH